MNDDPLLRHLRAMKTPARLDKDLWPRFEQRVHHTPRFTRCDWAIAAAAAALFLLYPELAAALLYHL